MRQYSANASTGSAGGASLPDTSLPAWDLTDLYPSPDSPALEADFAAAEAASKKFETTYAGKLEQISGRALAAAIAEYERDRGDPGPDHVLRPAAVRRRFHRPRAIGQFYQTVNERVTGISSHLIFFTLELNRLDDAALEQKLADPDLARWRPWLRDLRVFRPHQLSDDLEKLLHEKEVTGRSAWSRLFDETIAGMRVPIGTEELTVSAALNKLSDRRPRRARGRRQGDRPRVRRPDPPVLADHQHAGEGQGDHRHLAPLSDGPAATATAPTWSRTRWWTRWSRRCAANYPRLSHRYYTMKAKWLGLEKLQHWDRNAPLPDDDDRVIPWAEARQRVLSAYGAFSPELAAVGQQFFDQPWIDAAPTPGKSGGAFAHPTVPSRASLSAAELSRPHARRDDAGARARPRRAPGAGRRAGLPDGRHAADAGGNRQRVRRDADLPRPAGRRDRSAPPADHAGLQGRGHAEHRGAPDRVLSASRRGCTTSGATGEILPERIGEIWLEVQTESLGPAFEFTPEYSVFWSYIPHFIHTPFYVYAYAFGDCLVNALYSVFQGGHPGFQAEIPGHAARRRHQAAPGIAGAVRAGRRPTRPSGRAGWT